MNKYFAGSIYVNYYLDGAAGAVGLIFGTFIFNCCKIRWSYVIVISNVILGGVALLCFEGGYWSPDWIKVFLPDQKSPHPEGSQEEHDYYLTIVIPFVVFYIKVFLSMSWQITYTISFGDNKIFPFYSRATAITICNFVARSVTIASSLAAELPRPWPASLLIGFSVVSLIASLFLPSYSEELEFEEFEEEEEDENSENNDNLIGKRKRENGNDNEDYTPGKKRKFD